MTGATFCSLKLLCSGIRKMRVDNMILRTKTYCSKPRYRPPHWYVPKERVGQQKYIICENFNSISITVYEIQPGDGWMDSEVSVIGFPYYPWVQNPKKNYALIADDFLTNDNKQFVEEVLKDRLKAQAALESPLVNSEPKPEVQWNPYTRRVGLIARKIGNYPLWSKDGKKIQTTLLQVVDNHVIKYIPPEEFSPMRTKKVNWREKRTLGCLLVGSETIDPSRVTKGYSGLFDSVGMLPKRYLHRFMVSPHAALPTGTPLFATHFRVGDYVDVRAKTIDRGFQGVMKRWGFKGMPASHGQTKTHRRPGNIGGGGEKGRVWPGTKMPGHMGNRWRILRGVKILRMNTEHNVLWMLGVGIPGETGAICCLFDTVIPNKKLKSPPPFPTHPAAEDLPIEYYDESIHPFEENTILFDEL